MSVTDSITVDYEKCTGCGFCLRVCPDNIFSLSSGKASLTIKKCIKCGHCIAVCPEEAIIFKELENSLGFITFKEKFSWLPYGQSDVSELVQLLRSRRSCRNYTSKPVKCEILEDLVKVGTTAPSGTNSQAWTFTILPSRSQVVALGEKVASFYRELNKKAANPFLRFLSKIFLKDSLGKYHERYYPSISQGLKEWDNEGKDRLFHGATAVIIIGSGPEASCPAEDAMLATQNILIAAHAMGLGTCLIGFAVEAFKRDRNLTKYLNLPGTNNTYSVVAIGYPAEKYKQVTARKKVTPLYPKIKTEH